MKSNSSSVNYTECLHISPHFCLLLYNDSKSLDVNQRRLYYAFTENNTINTGQLKSKQNSYNALP